VGGLNWLFSMFSFNLVTTVFGESSLSKFVYLLVGLSAIYILLDLGKFAKK
ncbi:MAG: hypothetical protein QG630_418, partial [Patescibacteria group bacterium]|nr:hypothetical protein [Patescibacteria group bacterium]